VIFANFLVGCSCLLWTKAIDWTSTQLIQDHLSGTSQKLFFRIALELFIAGSFVALWMQGFTHYFFGKALFMSLISISLLTDMRVMLISRLVTLYTIPIGLFLSAYGFLPISFFESIIGAMLGYGLLVMVARFAYRSMGQHGLGEGDIDLLTMIGVFTGPLGCWFALLIGSIIGSIVGLISLLIGHSRHTLKLPFGTFLAIGAILFTLFFEAIYSFLFLSIH
jgi:leader peptidase (prepilin peptidase) / N-methyltransferase